MKEKREVRKGRSYLWNCCVQEEEGKKGQKRQEGQKRQKEEGRKGLERLHHVSDHFMH